MPTKMFRRLSAVAGLAAALGLTMATAKEPLPTGLTEKLIEGDIAYLQKQLDKGTPEKRAVPTIKATAILIAAYAQDNLSGAKADQMAGLRNGALKVAEAVAKKDFAAAKTAVAGLKNAKGGDNKPVDLTKQAKLSIEEVMSTFRRGTVGGRNIEADLKAQAKALTDVALAAEIGGRSAALGMLSEKMPIAAATGAKLKQWTDWSKEMKDLGTQLGMEAGKGATADKKKVADLLKKLDKNCVDCHNVFKD